MALCGRELVGCAHTSDPQDETPCGTCQYGEHLLPECDSTVSARYPRIAGRVGQVSRLLTNFVCGYLINTGFSIAYLKRSGAMVARTWLSRWEHCSRNWRNLAILYRLLYSCRCVRQLCMFLLGFGLRQASLAIPSYLPPICRGRS